MIHSSYLETIGRTPIVRLGRLFPHHLVYMKIEKGNPGGSIKDRIAIAMIEDAEQRGILKPGSTIIEPTSGNTGIGLALVCAIKGYPLILVMPESMSSERRKLMAAYGAQFELTPREQGMKGAIEKAALLSSSLPNSWMPMQFDNPSNFEAHKKTTAVEILNDFPDGLDYLISGVGTGGHLSGTAALLKEKFSQLQVFAVEPSASAVLAGNPPAPHALQGIGAGFIPSIMRTDLLSGSIAVEKDEAFHYTREAAKKEGILMGISGGASLAAVAQKLPHIGGEKKVLTFCYDTGERYLSTEGLF